MIASLGPDLSRRVQTCKVLVVGAGGIGCELLKNLALSGFSDIEVVDLDTIDLSNLNRQFLFRKEHISHSKSHVAAEIVKNMCPLLNIRAYNANIITDPTFSVDYFARFDVVMNALDNIKARQHVNMMCLAAGVPLLESGTAGLLGQATVHLPGESECFDCLPHEQPKAFPVCTIRSTPSQFIHCVVWAKSYLFAQLFGAKEDSLDAAVETPNDMSELKDLEQESKVLQDFRNVSNATTFVSEVFDCVFNEDIQRLLLVPDRWKDGNLPRPVKYEDIDLKILELADSSRVDREHEMWSLEKCGLVFSESCIKLRDRLHKFTSLEFDKDDDDIMDFVTAAACIRALIFSIPYKTRFDTKQDAGNIIPAIATTNAIIAGIVVLNAFKLLAQKKAEARNVYLTYSNPKSMLSTMRVSAVNKDCQVCSIDYRQFQVNTQTYTLRSLIEKEIKTVFELNGDISIVRHDGNLIYDPDFEDNVDKSLTSLKITDGKYISITDDDDSAGGAKRIVTLFVSHSESAEPILSKVEAVGLKTHASFEHVGSSKRTLESVEEQMPSKKQRIELEDDFVVLD